MKLIKIGSFLKRSKIPIDIEDNKTYKRVTIRIKHNGVSLRDTEVGKKIGTKKQFILKSGQFVLSKIDARYGAFGIAPTEVEGAIITGNFWAYNVDKKKVNIEWFNQFTNSPEFYNLCERASSGITHRKYLDEDFFLNYEILLPDVEEQLIQIENIKEKKKSFGELTSELSHQQSLLKQLRHAFLKEAMQGTLVEQNPNDEPASELLKKIKTEKEKLIAAKKLKKEKELPPIKEEEVPFEIPDNWVWCRLGEICSLITSGSRDWNKYYSNEGALFIRSQNIKPTEIELSNKAYVKLPKSTEGKRTEVKEKDILITITGAGVSNTGILENVDFSEGYVSQHISLVRMVDTRISKWIHSSIISENVGKSQFLNLIYGDKPGLNLAQINRLIVPLPPLAEQVRILKKLGQLMSYCNELEESISQSQQYKKQLLQQVLKEALKNEQEVMT